jgi:hypothetical protein
MSVSPFHGWRKRVVWMPDGHQLVCYFSRNGSTSPVRLDDINRNVYRLDTEGEIVWQVQRDDSNHPPDWWEGLHRHARDEGFDGAHEPFMEFLLEYADGSNNKTDMETVPLVARWVPGCKIWLRGSAYQQYILDPQTGIAKNVTKWPVRPW